MLAVLLAARPPSTSTSCPTAIPLFVTLSDGSIRNGYTIRVMNKEHAAKDYELSVAGTAAGSAVQGHDGHGAGGRR